MFKISIIRGIRRSSIISRLTNLQIVILKSLFSNSIADLICYLSVKRYMILVLEDSQACLLSTFAASLRYYNEYYNVDLLETYCKAFGWNKVCLAPVEDFHHADSVTLQKKILPFLADSDAKGELVVVHCSGWLGRTGHVLAAWLVFKYGLPPDDAIKVVQEAGRNPCDAVYYGYATMDELYSLLHRCRKDNIV